MTQRRHFLVLDALRGVAALGVLVFHTSYGLPSGILAVDLFFMLSGFVIAFSYEDQLLHGLSVSEFALRRFVRLYPMILLGSIAGLLAFLIHNATQSPGYPAAKIIRAFAF